MYSSDDLSSNVLDYEFIVSMLDEDFLGYKLQWTTKVQKIKSRTTYKFLTKCMQKK